jgi:hypothetical protein
MDPWAALEAAGLPAGAVRAAPSRLDMPLVRAAVRMLADRPDPPDAFDREPLLAWLRAWRHHWPDSFERELGADGERLTARLDALPRDANRYLKLRRIAVENLAGVL